MWSKAIVGLVVAVSVAVPAAADTDSLKDPKNDMGFDIVRVSQGHGRDRAYMDAWLKHTVEFRQGFSARGFKREGDLWLDFSTHDRRIQVRHHHGEWHARMMGGPGEIVGHPKVWRPDGKTISVSFPTDWVEQDLDRYRWKAHSVFYGAECDSPDGGCPSVAPADPSGALVHEL